MKSRDPPVIFYDTHCSVILTCADVLYYYVINPASRLSLDLGYIAALDLSILNIQFFNFN